MKQSLSAIQRLYDWWGKHPSVFKIAAWAAFMGREAHLRHTAVESILLQEGSTVLDLACGTGANLALLEEHIGRRGRLLAFDYNRRMLAAARRRIVAQGWENVRFVRGDAARISLREESLDGALCSLALSVIPDHRAAIEGVHRALKAGGRFVVLHANLFEGVWSPINPVLVPIAERITGWDADKDLIGGMDQTPALGDHSSRDE